MRGVGGVVVGLVEGVAGWKGWFPQALGVESLVDGVPNRKALTGPHLAHMWASSGGVLLSGPADPSLCVLRSDLNSVWLGSGGVCGAQEAGSLAEKGQAAAVACKRY